MEAFLDVEALLPHGASRNEYCLSWPQESKHVLALAKIVTLDLSTTASAETYCADEPSHRSAVAGRTRGL